MIGAVLIGCALLGAATFFAFAGDKETQTAAPPEIVAEPARGPVADPGPQVAAPETPETALETGEEIPNGALPSSRTVAFRSTPLGATVRIDGEVVGRTPFRQDLAGAFTARFTLRGHAPREVDVDEDADQVAARLRERSGAAMQGGSLGARGMF